MNKQPIVIASIITSIAYGAWGCGPSSPRQRIIPVSEDGAQITLSERVAQTEKTRISVQKILSAFDPVEGFLEEVARALDGRVLVDGHGPQHWLQQGVKTIRQGLERTTTTLLRETTGGGWILEEGIDLPVANTQDGCASPKIRLEYSETSAAPLLAGIEASIIDCGTAGPIPVLSGTVRGEIIELEINTSLPQQLASAVPTDYRLNTCRLSIHGSDDIRLECSDLGILTAGHQIQVHRFLLVKHSAGITGVLDLELLKKNASETQSIAKLNATVSPGLSIQLDVTTSSSTTETPLN